MPRQQLAHFDPFGLLAAVQQQDVGIKVSTNDPDGFRRLCYSAMRENPTLRCYIYADPGSRRMFLLIKSRLENHIPLEDPHEPAA